MDGGTDSARARLIDTVRTGNWERIPAEVDAYGAAVRADERRRAVDDAVEAIKKVFGEDNDERRAADWRTRCLAALEGVY
jgi:hypothetical protein